MELLKIHEPVNGKVVTDWEFTEEEIHFFVEYAVLDILEKQLKKMKPELKTCFDCGEIVSAETLKEFPDTELCGDCLTNN